MPRTKTVPAAGPKIDLPEGLLKHLIQGPMAAEDLEGCFGASKRPSLSARCAPISISAAHKEAAATASTNADISLLTLFRRLAAGRGHGVPGRAESAV